jgi:hypothetical protein
MRKSNRKLSLNRQTLVPLQHEQLHDVAGGISPSLVISIFSALSAHYSISAYTASAFGCGGKK